MAVFYPDGKGPNGWWTPMYGLRLSFAVEDPGSWEIVLEPGKPIREGPSVTRWDAKVAAALWSDGRVVRVRDWAGEHDIVPGVSVEAAVALDLFRLELLCEGCGQPIVREVIEASEHAAREAAIHKCWACLGRYWDYL